MVNILEQTIPQPLKKGDEVITIAASGAIIDKTSFLQGVKVLETWGLICNNHHISRTPWGYLASNDETRYRELHLLNQAPLMGFIKGGWGAARLLERPQPWKIGWIFGFSDVSSILLARLAAGYSGGVHGPLITSLPFEPEWSQERLRSILFGEKIPDLLGEPWVKGIASGPLVISNLSVGSHLIGSKHFPDLHGAILILEDVNEEPYKIDRMLTHWRLAGKMNGLAGLGFGNFKGCEIPREESSQNSFKLEEVLKDRCFDLGIPVVGDLPIGHCCGNASFPLGHLATLDGTKGTLSLNF